MSSHSLLYYIILFSPSYSLYNNFLAQDTCNQLKDLNTASPAVKLFAQWCEKAPIDPLWRGRFKVNMDLYERGEGREENSKEENTREETKSEYQRRNVNRREEKKTEKRRRKEK